CKRVLSDYHPIGATPSFIDAPTRAHPLLFVMMGPRPPSAKLFPYTTLFRSWPRNALTHENTKPVSRRFQGSITSGGIRMLRKPSLPRSPSHWYEHGEPVASALGRTSHERKARQVSLHHARSHVMTENSKLMS